MPSRKFFDFYKILRLLFAKESLIDISIGEQENRMEKSFGVYLSTHMPWACHSAHKLYILIVPEKAQDLPINTKMLGT